MCKGTGYRLTILNDNVNVRKQISEDISKFILNIAIKYNLPTQACTQSQLVRGPADMGLQFLFMDDNAPCHRTVAAYICASYICSSICASAAVAQWLRYPTMAGMS
ncbi:hypothetical protein TNCV_1112451 [Trichonephila clavipes]|uniref:Uncharacterized protein n=1 Tax=Trichonephila clavipes TaxID=2585209 RepID=A0A8X6RC76_TRICX|nr:hypothetical protein TNCV_1112451 [Trichonephila clavipes]